MNLRRLIGFNLLTAIVLAVVGFYVGWWLGHQITGPSIEYFGDTHQNDIALFVAYLVGVIGFLVGLGFANYPVQRLLGKPPSLREKEQQGLARYFGLCTDHKVVGIQYLLGIGAFIFIGGLNAMLIRFELMRPQHLVWNGNNYLTLVGVHGTMMMGMMTSGILGPFANYFVPIMIGSRRMAFPRIEALTFWLLMAAGTVLMTSWLFGGFPTGWTGYAPLNEQSNMGIDAYIAFFALVGVSMALLGLNMLVTVITMRAPGLDLGAPADLRLGHGQHLGPDAPGGADPHLDAPDADDGPHRADELLQRPGRRQLVSLREPLLVLRSSRGLHPRHPRHGDPARDPAGVRAQAAVGLPPRRHRVCSGSRC